ncbi:metallophosphoesterase [Bartonella massiliensis]|uniref:metallophosphoesterase n=1 Tax=Bartonella massiliensis TaxID=929795 RepID=UPI00115A0A8C|nr:metallophosphoesterase [Bartonella massiliensis]
MKSPTISMIIVTLLNPFFLVSEKTGAMSCHVLNDIAESKIQSEKLQNHTPNKKNINDIKNLRNSDIPVKNAQQPHQLKPLPTDSGDVFQQQQSQKNKHSKAIQKPQKQSQSSNNYTIIIAADPQAWRLTTGDPNSIQNRAPWLRKNKNVAAAIKSHKADFIIVNGDLTEYGRKATYSDYANIYKKLGIPVYEGLGNHDYANNAHDCMIPRAFNFFQDACAISAVERMVSEIKKYEKTLSNFNKHLSEQRVSNGFFYYGFYFIQGSLSYSWDYGDIHYVQLHNYPLYEVTLKDLTTSVRIKNSLDWLKKDLEAADKRGKVTILNFHDARPYYRDRNSHFLLPKNAQKLAVFKSIITKHNVIAIFVGHAHREFYCRGSDDPVFGNIPIYTSGALFKGHYYLVDVHGKDFSVKGYNGETGVPILDQDLGRNGTYRSPWDNCSNL